MKRFLCILMILTLILAFLPSCGNSSQPYGAGTEESDKMPNTVVITVKDYGTITVELYPEIAPISVSNFKGLVYKHYYDGLTFHRVIMDFMIQGGAGESVGSIKGEFSENGVNNSLKHERGVISMARGNPNDSASSQFFICHKTSPHLDGKYAAFGKVTEGMDVVDKIASVPTDGMDAPLVSVVIEKIRFAGEE